MKYALITAIALSLSFGLITESFRYQSTAGLFEDDYDLLFDPARICEIDGSRLWTSLSNLVTGNEGVFSNTSVQYYLFGGSTKFGNYSPGLVFDNYSLRLPMPTTLRDVNNNIIYGDAEHQRTIWEDRDGDGKYDYLRDTLLTQRAFEEEKTMDFYLGLGITKGTLRFGLGFFHIDALNKSIEPWNNGTYSYVEKNLVLDDTTLIEKGNVSGESKFNNANNSLILSLWKDMEKMKIGINTGYQFLSWKESGYTLGDYARYTDPDNIAAEHELFSEVDTLDIPKNGSRLPLNLTLFYNYNENNQGRFYLGIYTQSSDIADGASGIYTYSGENNIGQDKTVGNDTSRLNYYGSGNSMGFHIGTKQLFKVTDRLNIGLGLLFSSNNYFDSLATQDSSVTITEFDFNDDGMIDANDRTTTIWSKETDMTKTTGKKNIITLPVGVEFKIVEPLSFRLGAIHTVTYNDSTTIMSTIAYEPERTRIVLGDGTILPETIETPVNKPGSSETHTTTDRSTDYYYGLGWQVNKNLQIDLMGFSNLVNLSNWRLSATFKF